MSNIARLYGTASSSGTPGSYAIPSNPATINDGDYATGSLRNAGVSSVAQAPKSIWHIDLGTAYDIEYMKMSVGGNNVDYVGAFSVAIGPDNDPGTIWARLEYSDNNSTWTAATGTISQVTLFSKPYMTMLFPSPISARYWRVYYQGHYNNRYFGGVNIYSLELIADLAPNVAFTGSPTSGIGPLSVQFTDLSSNEPTSWLWDFGDGTTSTAQNPAHLYTSPGSYDVKLTATNGDGSNSVTHIAYINVRSQPVLPRLRDRILLSIRASFNDENLYNHALVIATGNKAAIVYGEASDTDPNSPTRIEAIGDRVFRYETDLITTQQTANKAAMKAFLDNCLVSEDIALEAICNPALEGNDVIGVQELTFSQIERNFRLQSFTIPLSSSRQSMKVARVINLQTQTVSVNDDIILVGYEQTIKTTASTSAVVDVPVGTTDGDLMLMFAAIDQTAPLDFAMESITGFTSIPGVSNWKKRIAESEGSTKTVTWVGARRAIITLLVYRNVYQPNPVAGIVVTHGTGKTIAIPGLTLPSAEYHLIATIQGNGVTSYTFPAAWTEIVESDTGGTGTAHVAVAIADRPHVGANPPAFNATGSDDIYNTTYQIALRKDIS